MKRLLYHIIHVIIAIIADLRSWTKKVSIGFLAILFSRPPESIGHAKELARF